jgi:hypothetical protein
MSAVVKVQEISVGGRLAGVVIEDLLLLRSGLSGEEARAAQAMGLLAIDIHVGHTPGPYSQRRAQAFVSRARRGRARRRTMGDPER